MKEIQFTKYQASDGYIFDSEEKCLQHEEDLKNHVNLHIETEVEITTRLSLSGSDFDLDKRKIPTDKRELHAWIIGEIIKDSDDLDLIADENSDWTIRKKELHLNMNVLSYECKFFDNDNNVVSSVNYKAD